MRILCSILGLGLVLNPGWFVSAQEWTRFRGPNGSGLGQGTNLPTKWGENDYRWQAKVPGIGHSSPVLWGEKLFITSADTAAAQFTIICLNATDGSTFWQKK